MRAGACFIALASLCFALTACGGGSSGAVPAALATNTPAQATPSAQSTPSAYPGTSGDTLHYAGTLTQTFQSFPEIAAPGSPSPEPTSVTTIGVTQTIVLKTNQSFAGASGLVDLHSNETDAYTSGLKTTTSQTDTFEDLASGNASSSALHSYGSAFIDESGDSTNITYAPAQVLDELPETAGAQWNNTAGASVQEALAGGAAGSPVTVQRDVNADGSYTERTTYPQGYSAPGYTGVGQIAENSDGSGSFAWVANNSATTILYSVPVPQPTGSPLITVSVYNGLDPTPVATPNSAFQLTTWYGAAPALYNESDRDVGTVTVPAACGLSSSMPQQATELMRTIDRTDTVLGYTEHERTAAYVASGYGVICTEMSDTQTLYYDFNGDQPFVFTQVPPLEIVTTSETLALQPDSYITQSRRAQHAAALPRVDAAAVLRTSFERRLSALRATRVTRLIHAVHAIRASRNVR